MTGFVITGCDCTTYYTWLECPARRNNEWTPKAVHLEFASVIKPVVLFLVDRIQVCYLAIFPALVLYVCFARAHQHSWHRCPSSNKGAKAETPYAERVTGDILRAGVPPSIGKWRLEVGRLIYKWTSARIPPLPVVYTATSPRAAPITPRRTSLAHPFPGPSWLRSNPQTTVLGWKISFPATLPHRMSGETSSLPQYMNQILPTATANNI